jgi:hypothetical protein
MSKKIPRTMTLESGAYLDGLFRDFAEQVNRYKHLTAGLMQLEARLGLAEKTLCLTRDHLEMALHSTEGSESRLHQFQKDAANVQFVGMRLTDACTVVLREHKKMTPEKLLDAINEGTFRFKTNSPLREIHAALLRHPHVERRGSSYVWTGPKEEQTRPQLSAARIAESGRAEVKPN